MIDAGLILAISIILVLLNLLLLDRANNQLTAIDEARVTKLGLVKHMKQIIRERSIVMLDLAAEKDAFDFQDKYLRFHRLAIEFVATRNELVGYGLEESEQLALQQALSTIRRTEPMQNGIVERIRGAIMADQRIKGIHYEIAKDDVPLEFALLGQMEELTELIISNTNRQRLQTKKQYQRVAILVSIVSFAFILTIILLMARSLRKIRKIETGLITRAESLNWDATHDPLTNIYNRRWLEHKIEFLMDKERSDEKEHSLLYLDLDGFKQINDSYGHVAGDNYLVEFCREVEHTVRQNDTFCRMGGDEFAILLENCRQDASTKIANELVHRIGKFTLAFEDKHLNASCSIGICQFGNGDLEFDNLVHRADELCYEAKRKGKNRIEVGKYE